MLVVKDRQLFRRERIDLALLNRCSSQLQVLVEPGVHRFATDLIVVVSELEPRRQLQLVAGPQQVVELFQFGVTLLLDFRVQSFAAVRPSGLGANIAANSTFP